MTTYTRKPLYRRGAGASASSFWRGVLLGTETSGSSVPATAILTEDGAPILTELGEYLVVES